MASAEEACTANLQLIKILQGPFLTSKHFLPALSSSKQGKIINVSSDMASIEGI
jgi:NAD(P)-dependent dehydrogenase (short-subunit alcohol dehydrogenase family)